jgi:hypothetical protein
VGHQAGPDQHSRLAIAGPGQCHGERGRNQWPGVHTSGSDRFEEFISTPPFAGIGGSMDMLRRLCKDGMEALDLIDQAVQ